MSFCTTINNIKICGNCGDIAFTGDTCPLCNSNHSEPLHHFIKNMGYVTQAKEEKSRTTLTPLITPRAWLKHDPFAYRRELNAISLQEVKGAHRLSRGSIVNNTMRMVATNFKRWIADYIFPGLKD